MPVRMTSAPSAGYSGAVAIAGGVRVAVFAGRRNGRRRRALAQRRGIGAVRVASEDEHGAVERRSRLLRRALGDRDAADLVGAQARELPVGMAVKDDDRTPLLRRIQREDDGAAGELEGPQTIRASRGRGGEEKPREAGAESQGPAHELVQHTPDESHLPPDTRLLRYRSTIPASRIPA